MTTLTLTQYIMFPMRILVGVILWVVIRIHPTHTPTLIQIPMVVV